MTTRLYICATYNLKREQDQDRGGQKKETESLVRGLQDTALSCKSVRSLSPARRHGRLCKGRLHAAWRVDAVLCFFPFSTLWPRFCTLACRWLCTQEDWPVCAVYSYLHTRALSLPLEPLLLLSSRTTLTILLLTMHLIHHRLRGSCILYKL